MDGARTSAEDPQAEGPFDPILLLMDLTRLRQIIADGRYAIDPVAVAEAVLRAPDLAGLLAASRPVVP